MPCYLKGYGEEILCQAEEIWITSNISPENWYPNCSIDQREAIFRRLTTIAHFDGKFPDAVVRTFGGMEYWEQHATRFIKKDPLGSVFLRYKRKR